MYEIRSLERIKEICNQLSGVKFPFCQEIMDLVSQVEKFSEEYKEFMEEEKAIVSVIGVVKAGKSSFLNCLLFDGRDLLPKAITPLTAALTILEYGKDNRAEVIYLTPHEFQYIEHAIIRDGSEKEKRLLPLLKKRLSEKPRKETIIANSPEELLEKLEEFITSESELSYIVKEIYVKIDLPSLEKLKIVDTPGLNDPVLTRSQKTLDFIRKSHVVFHLSRTSQFLESEDLGVIERYALEKIKRLYLVGSRYDETLKELRFQLAKKEAKASRSKSLLEKLKKGKTKKALTPEKVEKFIQILRKKCQERMNQYGLNNPFSLFSALFFKIEKGIADADERELWERLSTEAKLEFSKSLIDYSEINELQKRLEEVKRERDEIVKKRKEDFFMARKNSIEKSVDGLRVQIHNYLSKNEETFLIVEKFLKELEKGKKFLKEKLSNEIKKIGNNYNQVITRALEHIKEATQELSLVVDVKIEEVERKIKETREVTKCLIFTETKTFYRTKIELVKREYINVDKSIQKVKEQINSRIRFYRQQLIKVMVSKQKIISQIQMVISEFLEELKRKIEKEQEIKQKTKELEKIKVELKEEIKSELERLKIPDPLEDLKFPKEKFRETLEKLDLRKVSIEDANAVYQHLMKDMLLVLWEKAEEAKRNFFYHLGRFSDNICNSITTFIKNYYQSLQIFMAEKEKLSESLNELISLLPLLVKVIDNVKVN